MARANTTAQYIRYLTNDTWAPSDRTWIVVCKRATDSAGTRQRIFATLDGAPSARLLIAFGTTDKPEYGRNAFIAATSMTVKVADGWVLLAVTCATGTTIPRFHKYVFNTSTWTHENGTGTAGEPIASSNGGFVLGRGDVAGTNPSPNSYAALAYWTRLMTDDEIETVGASVASMMSHSPVGLWLFDYEATGGVNSPLKVATVSTDTSTLDGDGTPISYGYPVMNDQLPFISSQTVSPTAIATAEAFGTVTVSETITLSPSSIASAEAFGTPAVSTSVTVSPSAIATAESFGTVALSAAITVSPSSITSAEAFGSPVLGGSITISPVSLGSQESFGTPVLEQNQLFDGPTYREPISRDWLWRNMHLDVGKCVLITGGVVTVVRYPTDEQMVAADVVLRGGMTHVISPETADILILAGLGEFIHGLGGAPSPVVEGPGDDGDAYDTAILADAPVLYWKLDDDPDASIAVDASGNGHDGSIAGVLVDGIHSGSTGALQLDGNALYNTGGLTSTPEFTYEFWISTTETTQSGGAQLFQSSPLRRMVFGCNDDGSGLVYAYWADDITVGSIGDVATTYNDGNPHLVTVRCDGLTFDLFLDAVSIGSIAYSGTPFVASGFEVQSFGGVQIFDSAAVYDTALSDERILAHYNAGVA